MKKKSMKQIWLEAVKELLRKYMHEGYLGGFRDGCPLCRVTREIFTKTSGIERDDQKWSSCERCIQKNVHFSGFSGDSCTHMNTYSSGKNITSDGNFDMIQGRIRFWKEVLKILKGLPRRRFENGVIIQRGVAFPKLWELDAEIATC